MLLPSALACDAKRPSLQRFARYTGRSWSTSPAPQPLAQPVVAPADNRGSMLQPSGGISNTCRALHSLLGLQPPPVKPLQPASTIFTPLSTRTVLTNTRVVKRPPLPTRGRKRRREIYEEEDEYDSSFSSAKYCASDAAAARPSSAGEDQENRAQPSTPKRQCRRAPTHIPFGLERRDFYDLPVTPPAADTQQEVDMVDDDVTPKARIIAIPSAPGSRTPRAPRRQKPSPRPNDMDFLSQPSDALASDSDGEEPGIDWSPEDDRMLVELVLDQLQLSRRQWDECARQLGAERRSLGARWRHLLEEGQVGLRLRRGGRRRRGDVRGMWGEAM